MRQRLTWAHRPQTPSALKSSPHFFFLARQVLLGGQPAREQMDERRCRRRISVPPGSLKHPESDATH